MISKKVVAAEDSDEEIPKKDEEDFKDYDEEADYDDEEEE